MTSSANDEWNHADLEAGIDCLLKIIALAPKNPNSKQLYNCVEFIQYNMKEMEITGGNGDD